MPCRSGSPHGVRGGEYDDLVVSAFVGVDCPLTVTSDDARSAASVVITKGASRDVLFIGPSQFLLRRSLIPDP